MASNCINALCSVQLTGRLLATTHACVPVMPSSVTRERQGGRGTEHEDGGRWVVGATAGTLVLVRRHDTSASPAPDTRSSSPAHHLSQDPVPDVTLKSPDYATATPSQPLGQHCDRPTVKYPELSSMHNPARCSECRRRRSPLLLLHLLLGTKRGSRKNKGREKKKRRRKPPGQTSQG